MYERFDEGKPVQQTPTHRGGENDKPGI